LISIVTFLLQPEKLAVYQATDLWIAISAVISNVILFGQDMFVFFGLNQISGDIRFMPMIMQGDLVNSGPGWVPGWNLLLIEQGWSIGVEMWFYLLAPFLLRRGIGVILVAMVLSFATRLILTEVVGWKGDPWGYRFFPNELFVFLAGSLAHRAYANGILILDRQVGRYLLCSLIIVLTLFHTMLPFGSAEKRWIYMFILVVSLPTIFQITKSIAWDRWIGELSYPIYLVHFVPLILMQSYVDRPMQGWVNLLISIGLAALLVWSIDSRVDRWRHHLVSRIQSRYQR
tara:strand:+ start:302 stop:1162 length:861 start_codon:yes stop_codon:yes gene_type:complete